MLPATIETYSGQKKDAVTPKNPRSQYGSDAFNKAHDDLAQLTRSATRVAVDFLTLGSNGFVDPVANITHATLWGRDGSLKPTVERTGAGLYTVQWPTTFNDGLDPATPETLALIIPTGILAYSATVADDVGAFFLTVSANQVTIKVESPIGTLADVGNSSAVAFRVALALI